MNERFNSDLLIYKKDSFKDENKIINKLTSENSYLKKK